MQVQWSADLAGEPRFVGDPLRADFIAACRGAITGLMAEVLQGHIREHIVDRERGPSPTEREAIEQLVDVVRAFLK